MQIHIEKKIKVPLITKTSRYLAPGCNFLLVIKVGVYIFPFDKDN